jgi:hypothetical protein
MVRLSCRSLAPHSDTRSDSSSVAGLYAGLAQTQAVDGNRDGALTALAPLPTSPTAYRPP